MSLKPAIGKRWFDTYKTDCYPSDFITQKGRKLRVPKYYDTLLAAENPKQLERTQNLSKEQDSDKDIADRCDQAQKRAGWHR